MSGAPLIIGEAQRVAFAKLRDYASAHPLDMQEVVRLTETREGHAKHVRRMKRYTLEIPTAFVVTYSIETGHPDPKASICRHMSMSSRRKGKVPTPDAVWMICEELGFRGSLQRCAIWQEEIGGGDVAINVVQPIYDFRPEGHA